ncbi:hypothetical protein [Mangrovibacter yixingensis]|nr:hypothetical protein [Mangrovibacter yixingensis]
MKHHRPNQQSKVWPWFWQKKIPPIRGRIRGATDAEDIWPEVTYQLIRVE